MAIFSKKKSEDMPWVFIDYSVCFCCNLYYKHLVSIIISIYVSHIFIYNLQHLEVHLYIVLSSAVQDRRRSRPSLCLSIHLREHHIQLLHPKGLRQWTALVENIQYLVFRHSHNIPTPKNKKIHFAKYRLNEVCNGSWRGGDSCRPRLGRLSWWMSWNK